MSEPVSKPECVGKKVLVSGATPFDPQNKIKPFKAMACETTNGEYRVFEEGTAGSRFELVVTTASGTASVAATSASKEDIDKAAAKEAAKSDVKAVEKRAVIPSARPPLDPKLAGDYQPVANVSADDALKFCQAQLDENGNPGRLPTNDEWEKMARGPKGFDFGTSDGTLKCGKNASCDAEVSSVVGSFAASGFGTYDTVGNVWEWTKESNGDTYIRGGSWFNYGYAGDLRASYRYNDYPGYRSGDVGVRCVWDVKK